MHITYSNAFFGIPFYIFLFTQFRFCISFFFVFLARSLILWSCEIYQSMCVCDTKTFYQIYRLTVIMKIAFTWYFFSLSVSQWRISFIFSHHSVRCRFRQEKLTFSILNDVVHLSSTFSLSLSSSIFGERMYDSTLRFIDCLFNDFLQLNFE